MSEKEKPTNESVDTATLTWDSLSEDIDWLEKQAESGDEATREKAVRLIKENYAHMQRIIDEIDGKEPEYDDPKDITSNTRVEEAEPVRKPRQMAPGEPITFKTDEEVHEEMKRRYEEQP